MAEIDDLREEVAFWRRDAAARLWSATALHSAAVERGDDDAATDLRINHMAPALFALRDADGKDWHLTCEGCGKPLLNGQRYMPFEDANGIHVNCDDPASAAEEEGSLIWDDGFSETDVARIIARAKAIVDG